MVYYNHRELLVQLLAKVNAAWYLYNGYCEVITPLLSNTPSAWYLYRGIARLIIIQCGCRLTILPPTVRSDSSGVYLSL